jgi:hypothetical protein
VSFAVRHHVDGPRVRLGVAWLAGTVVACVLSPLLLALVLAVAAALAADELLTLHGHPAGGHLLEDHVRLTTGLIAAGIPLAASQGVDTLTAACAAGVLLAVVGIGGRAVGPLFVATTVGLAAASPVLLQRLGTAAALFLLLFVAAYDAADFLIGTGANAPWEGPAAGAATVAVVAFGGLVLSPPPLQEAGVVALGAAVALLAPLGPLVASVLIGDGSTRARYVRRIDSLLVAGPVAAYVVMAVVSR